MKERKPHKYYFKETLVGFFDIMGYSSYLSSESEFDSAVRKQTELVAHIKNLLTTDFLGIRIFPWALSDSIIIVIDTSSSPLNRGSLNLFFFLCAALMDALLGFLNTPIRGAIGGGHFFKSEEVLVSTALVDAANFEKEQEWLGAVITPKAKALLEKFEPEYFKSPSEEYGKYVQTGLVPFKNGFEEALYVNPTKVYTKGRFLEHIPIWFDKNKKRTMLENSKFLYEESF